MAALVPSRISETPAFCLLPKSLIIRGSRPRNPEQSPPERTKIFNFSHNSRRRLRFVALNAWPQLVSQFCLTYHNNYPTDGAELKKHLHRFFMNFRKKYKGFGYLWLLEFQQRGAPHFHLFLPFIPNPELGQKLADIWLKASGQQNDAAARAFHTHEKNFITWDMGNGSYVCKYLEKSRQKDVPENFLNVGRFWGSSRGLVPMPIDVDFDSFSEAYDIADEETGVCSDAVILAARWLGKWYERQRLKKQRKFTRNFRKMAIKTGWTLATAAPAFRQIDNYLAKQAKLQRESDYDLLGKMAILRQRKAMRNAFCCPPPSIDSESHHQFICAIQSLPRSDYQ